MDGRTYRVWLIALLIVSTGLSLANAATYPVGAGYDAGQHIAYADGLVQHGTLPTNATQSEYYSPPAFYALAGIADRVGSLLGLGVPERAAQALNGLVEIGTVLLVLALARELWPDRPLLHLASVGYMALVPVAVQAAAMFHPEPLDLFLATAALWVGVRLVRRTEEPARAALALGALLALGLLTRQFAAFVAVPVLATLLLAGRLRAVAIAAACAVALAAPWYARQALAFGNPVFAQPAPPRPLLERRPVSFYLGTGLSAVLTDPVRRHFVNEAVPVTYTGLWGDYFGHWAWNGSRDPVSRTTRRTLAVQNALGLLPTALAVGGWLALLAGGARRRDVRLLAVALVPLCGFLGYAYFTIGYPTRDGDVLKPIYMLTTASAWALAFGYAVEQLARRRGLRTPLVGLLLASAAVDLMFVLYPVSGGT